MDYAQTFGAASCRRDQVRLNSFGPRKYDSLSLRALLPDIVKFSYIPRNDSAINENADLKGKHRAKSPDFVIPSTRVSNASGEGRILVLEFADNLRGNKSRNAG